MNFIHMQNNYFFHPQNQQMMGQMPMGQMMPNQYMNMMPGQNPNMQMNMPFPQQNFNFPGQNPQNMQFVQEENNNVNNN